MTPTIYQSYVKVEDGALYLLWKLFYGHCCCLLWEDLFGFSVVVDVAVMVVIADINMYLIMLLFSLYN